LSHHQAKYTFCDQFYEKSPPQIVSKSETEVKVSHSTSENTGFQTFQGNAREGKNIFLVVKI